MNIILIPICDVVPKDEIDKVNIYIMFRLSKKIEIKYIINQKF